MNQTLTETLTDPLTQSVYTNSFPNLDLVSTIGSSTGYVGFSGATGGAIALQTVGNFSFNNFAQGPSIGNDVGIAAGGTATLDVVPPSAGGFGSATIRGKLTLNNNATLNATGGSTATDSAFRINVTGQTSIAGNSVFNVANNGTGVGTLDLGAIVEAGAGASLTKAGPGRLVITGNAGHTGGTTVNAGSLLVNGSLTGAATVNSGGTLGGTGSVGDVMVASGGTLSPGDGGIGTLTAFTLTLNGGSTLSLEIGATTADQAKAAGATLSGNIPLSLTLLADPVDFTTFKIVDGSFPLAGYATGAHFSYAGNSLDEGESFLVNSGGFNQFFTISYTADTARDVVLVAIPEPGSACLLMSALAVSAGWRRRVRR